MPAKKARSAPDGSTRCSKRNQPVSSRLRSPTRRRGLPGRCSSGRKIIGFRCPLPRKQSVQNPPQDRKVQLGKGSVSGSNFDPLLTRLRCVGSCLATGGIAPAARSSIFWPLFMGGNWGDARHHSSLFPCVAAADRGRRFRPDAREACDIHPSSRRR
jgi:hypothetical protein